MLICSVEYLADSQVGLQWKTWSEITRLMDFRWGGLSWKVDWHLLESAQLFLWTRHRCPFFFGPNDPNMVINDNILLQLAFIEPWQNDQKVLDPELGWSQFRSEYGSSSWRWIAAATRARYYPIQGFILVYSLPTLFRLILMSGTMSEDSLVRVAGIYNYQKVNIMYKFFFNRCSQRGQEHYSSAVQESLQTEPVPSNPDSWQDWNEVNAISIDQVVLTDSIRWRDRDLGFLLPLAVTGKKIQVGSHYQSHSCHIYWHHRYAYNI